MKTEYARRISAVPNLAQRFALMKRNGYQHSQKSLYKYISSLCLDILCEGKQVIVKHLTFFLSLSCFFKVTFLVFAVVTEELYIFTGKSTPIQRHF